jgi:release factor glutamine methyltransferase
MVDAASTHATVVAAVAARLSAGGVPGARVEARWLVEHVLHDAGGPEGDRALPGTVRVRQASSPATGAAPAATLQDAVLPARVEALVARRLDGEPLQLLLGRWPFRTVELELAPGVFVPRPETEVVAGVAIDHARSLGPGAVIAEPCTGTGAIAASLLAELGDVEVYATDRSAAAVALARRNLAAVTNGALSARAQVLEGDLLAPLPAGLRGRLDLIVANPPYLPCGDLEHLAPEVAEHDPPVALFGGVDGHEVVDRLLVAAGRWLRPGGVVVLEIDDRRGAEACHVARAAGLSEVHLVPDLAGRERAVVATAPARPCATTRLETMTEASPTSPKRRP